MEGFEQRKINERIKEALQVDLMEKGWSFRGRSKRGIAVHSASKEIAFNESWYALIDDLQCLSRQEGYFFFDGINVRDNKRQLLLDLYPEIKMTQVNSNLVYRLRNGDIPKVLDYKGSQAEWNLIIMQSGLLEADELIIDQDDHTSNLVYDFYVDKMNAKRKVTIPIPLNCQTSLGRLDRVIYFVEQGIHNIHFYRVLFKGMEAPVKMYNKLTVIHQDGHVRAKIDKIFTTPALDRIRDVTDLRKNPTNRQAWSILDPMDIPLYDGELFFLTNKQDAYAKIGGDWVLSNAEWLRHKAQDISEELYNEVQAYFNLKSI